MFVNVKMLFFFLVIYVSLQVESTTEIVDLVLLIAVWLQSDFVRKKTIVVDVYTVSFIYIN